jgi:hypothetical protein
MTLKIRARRGHANGGKANERGTEKAGKRRRLIGGLRKISQT